MKILYFALVILLFSCSGSVEEKCFVEKMNEREDVVIEINRNESLTIQQILAEKPDHLEIINLKKYRDFKKDIAEWDFYNPGVGVAGNGEDDFTIFNEKFSDQFLYFTTQKIGSVFYGLGLNTLGYWLLKIENDKPSAYFLGLSFNQYYLNRIQENPVIKNGFLQLEGSLVKVLKKEGLPGHHEYSALEDGKLFKMDLNILTKDSDNDGYNDIFEKSFGLNPDNIDTDGDGITDFEDMNPMFKSEKNKFSQLYELLLPDYGIADMKKSYYTFQAYQSDCDYFHQINPEQRVLFVSEENDKQTYYTRTTDVTYEYISKIQKNKKDSNNFYIYKLGSGFKNDYSAEYKNGKWILKIVGGYIV